MLNYCALKSWHALCVRKRHGVDRLATSKSCIFSISLSAAGCSNLTDPMNGRVAVMTGNSIGDTASYLCNDGFELEGALNLTCQSDGTWSDPPPTCRMIGMKSPPYFSSYKLKLPGTQCWEMEQTITVWYTSCMFQTHGTIAGDILAL